MCARKDSYVVLLLVYSKCTLIRKAHRKDQYFSLVSQKNIHAQRITKIE